MSELLGTPFLACPFLLKVNPLWRKDFIIKNSRHVKIGLSLRSMPPCISNYILCIQDLIFKQKYITGDHMLTLSNIFIESKSSTLVSDLYGLMRRILYLISVAKYCNIAMPLVNTVLSKKGLYTASHICMQCG